MTTRYGSLTLQLKQLSNLANIGSAYTDILINASGSQKLNAIGRGSFTFARNATLYAACIANVGQVAYVYVTDQVASGAAMDVATFVIEKVTTQLTRQGMMTTVDGPSIEEQLAFANLGDDTIDDGAGGRDTSSIASIMAYAPSGWSHNGTETTKGTYHVSRGDTVFKTLVDAAKQSGEFFRLSSYSAPAKQINWYNAADSSGVTLRMPTDPTTYDGSTTVGIVIDMSLSEDFAPTLSGIRPYGSGLEDGRLDLTQIDSGDTGADPSGYTTSFANNTITNNTLETALGYEKHEDVDFSHIKVEDPTNPAHITTASVALWDEAIYYLQQRDSTRKYYDVVCVVPYDLRPGQTVTIVYSEYEGGISGGTQTLNINTTFKILSVDNSYGVSTGGKRVTKLVVSDDIVTRPEAVHYIRAVMEKTQATTRKTNVSTSPGSVSTSRELEATRPLRIDNGDSADLSANRTYKIQGLSSFGASNQIVGANSGGTGWEYKTLTNGTGISITHGANTVTITNSTSHAQSHVLATTSALGPDHTVSGLTSGQVLQATGATTAVFGTLAHSNLGSIGVNDHHNQVHSITGSDHTITASQYQLVGATAANTLGLLTPSSTGTANAIARFDSNGRMQFSGIGVGTTADNDNAIKLADGSWVGLSASAGRVVFENLTTDEVRVQNADFFATENAVIGHNALVATTAHAGRTVEINGGDPLLSLINSDYDNHPVLQFEGSGGHDNCAIYFDAYFNGSALKSSDGTSNFRLSKSSDLLSIDYAAGVAAGSNVSFTRGFTVNRFGGVYINDTANASMTIGLTIQQDTNDDEGFAIKSTDVAHSIGDTETDTYFAIRKVSGGSGGARLRGYSEATLAAELTGQGTTDDTTKSTSALGYVELRGMKNNGTPGSNANLVVVRSNALSKWIIDAEGDTHRDGSDNTYDTYNDVDLCRAFDLAMSPSSVIESEFDKFLTHNRSDLVNAGILHESGFYNESKLLRLHNGAIWQMHQRILQLEEALNGTS